MGILTGRGANNWLVFDFIMKETYTVTSFEVSNWRLLFTPAMMMRVYNNREEAGGIVIGDSGARIGD